MFTIRNIGVVALFAAGSTWLWLTPAFATPGVSTAGVLWALTTAVCLLTMAGFCVATWGLFRRHSWWRPVSVGSAAIGLLAVATYWLAAARAGEPAGAATWNAFVHVLIVAGVFLLLLVPRLQGWVNRHVMTS